MNTNFRLLTVEQVFGEQKIDLIKAIGPKCGRVIYITEEQLEQLK